MEAIKKDLGIGFIPDFVCNTDIHAGKVVEIFADTPKPKLTLYALYPARQFAPARLMHCIQFMEEWFQQAPQK